MASRSLGTLTLDLVARVGGFTSGMTQAERAADKSLSAIEKRAYQFGQALGSGIKLAAGAALAGITALAAGLKVTIDDLDELSKSAQKVGITTEELSKLAYAGELADVSLETLVGSLGKLTKAQAAALDTGSKTAEVFDALGIAVKDADGNLRSSSAVLGDFAQRFKELGGSPEAVAAGFQLFGRSFQELIPLLKDGREGIEGAADELERMGGVISTETGVAAEEFNDNLTRLKTQFTSIMAQIAQQLLPVLVELTENFKGMAQNGDLARNAVTLLTGVIDLGVGALKLYSAAVDNVAIAIEQAVKSYEGWTEITRNASSFGFAEGTVVEGINKIRDAATEASAARERLAARRNATAATDPEAGGIDFSLGAPLSLEEQAAANRKLQAALAGTTEAKKKNTRASKELTEEEKRFRDQILEVNDLIDEMAQGAQSDLVNRRLDAQNQRADDVAQLLSDLEFEKSLVGQTADEQERLNALRYAGVEAASAEGKAIQESLSALQERRAVMEDQITAMDALRDAGKGFLQDLREGVSVGDALKEAFDSLLDRIYDAVVENLIGQLFGQAGSAQGGAGGGWFAQLAGAFFGGGRAGGGPVNAGTLYQVNERGPELLSVGSRDYLMMGANAGRVTRSDRIGGGAVVNVNNTYINPQLNDLRSEAQRQQREAENLRVASVRNGG